MRQPLKRMHIYEDLKRSISAGVYHQGAFRRMSSFWRKNTELREKLYDPS